ncbi:MAG: hypothetical protein HZC28_15715 [Spirochaetes bacterium]|nr:hypothetical protein [Spirochaetota bacterium]
MRQRLIIAGIALACAALSLLGFRILSGMRSAAVRDLSRDTKMAGNSGFFLREIARIDAAAAKLPKKAYTPADRNAAMETVIGLIRRHRMTLRTMNPADGEDTLSIELRFTADAHSIHGFLRALEQSEWCIREEVITMERLASGTSIDTTMRIRLQ